MKQFVQILQVLQSHNLIDSDGHKPNCGYTHENPNCECAELGQEINSILESVDCWRCGGTVIHLLRETVNET